MNKKLQKLLKKGQVWFDIPDENKKMFLRFAKFNGCKWINGDNIYPESDLCSSHMAITPNLELGYVSAMCWFAKAKKPHIEKFEVVTHHIDLTF